MGKGSKWSAYLRKVAFNNRKGILYRNWGLKSRLL
jgi:hypothetical protein